jgi:hypothetical protein
LGGNTETLTGNEGKVFGWRKKKRKRKQTLARADMCLETGNWR